MRIVKFAIGLGVGYVLGSRAGRDRFEQIAATARRAQDHPAVTQAQQKIKQLLGTPTGTTTADTDPLHTPSTTVPPDPFVRTPRSRPSSTTTSGIAATDSLT